jgi:hypothetical protein
MQIKLFKLDLLTNRNRKTKCKLTTKCINYLIDKLLINLKNVISGYDANGLRG